MSMTQDEIERTTALLKKLQPGFLPYPIFEQIARLVALPIVEFIPLRMNAINEIEVLLIDRGPDDPLWPNALHTPGTVIRATDTNKGERDSWSAFDRIIHDELQGTEISNPHYVGSILHDSRRGTEQAQLYWVEVLGRHKAGHFYRVNELPSELIESQVRFIILAAESYRRSKQVIQQ